MSLNANSPISIVSYNARGFRSGKAFIIESLCDCDILCLQEHWLLDEHLSDLNVCDDFIATGVSCGLLLGGVQSSFVNVSSKVKYRLPDFVLYMLSRTAKIFLSVYICHLIVVCHLGTLILKRPLVN